jgi:hypothetical protein
VAPSRLGQLQQRDMLPPSPPPFMAPNTFALSCQSTPHCMYHFTPSTCYNLTATKQHYTALHTAVRSTMKVGVQNLQYTATRSLICCAGPHLSLSMSLWFLVWPSTAAWNSLTAVRPLPLPASRLSTVKDLLTVGLPAVQQSRHTVIQQR